MTARQRIIEQYGERTVQALDDFIEHCDDAATMLAQRDRSNPLVDELVVEALILHLGESAKRAGDPFIADHPQLGLRDIVDARNFVAHGYDITNHDLLWASIERDLPTTAAAVRQVLAEGGPVA
ncbi:MAG: DUF86 domain-containing protein [Cellulomonadaceae bacterium]|jgi:uncharacterized protein with HEPN domain|nr:DUF86 domain-containing protein [Cellulomonadaceae bacterium]